MVTLPKRKSISAADFREMLADALAIVKELEVQSGGFAVYESVRLHWRR